MKGHEAKPNVLEFWPLPSLGSELVGVLAIYLFGAMHMVRRKADAESFSD
jgi:hypothetical protein